MKKYRLALLAAAALALFLLIPPESGQAGLGISGQERVKAFDIYLDPANTASVSYTIHLANGLAIEGSGDTWESMDQFLRLSEAVIRPNTTVIAHLKDDKVTSFLISAGSAF
jgi:hypothetical protein